MLIYYLSLLETEEEKKKLERIYLEYRQRMKAIALQLLGNDVDAEDALQDSFEKLIRVLDRIQEPVGNETAAFLTVIVKNTCRDHLRRKKVRIAYDLEEVDEQMLSDPADMMEHLNAEDLWRVIKSLPGIYCDALLLKFYFQLPDRKTAELLGLSAAGLQKRLRRAKNLLYEALEKEREYDECRD